MKATFVSVFPFPSRLPDRRVSQTIFLAFLLVFFSGCTTTQAVIVAKATPLTDSKVAARFPESNSAHEVSFKDEVPPLSQANQTAQVGAHIVDSNTLGVALRPVSSVFRLLFLIKDAVVETIRPTWMVSLDSQPIPPVSDGPGMDLSAWEEQLDRLTNRKSTRGEIEYLIDGAEYFSSFIAALNNAKESIVVRTYIFDNDDYATHIAQLLRARSTEGIDVRILLDGLGTLLAAGVHDESMPDEHIVPNSIRELLENGSGIVVRQAKNPFLAGDHVKTTVVDNTLAFTGGMNIGREYRYRWHDMMMALRGPVVDVLSQEFSDAWAHAGDMGDFSYFLHKLKPEKSHADDTGYPLRVLFTRPGSTEIFDAQREAIRNAKSYIYIQNAYFTDDEMLFELARARKRGVDVRVILPANGNHGPINGSNALAANAMIEQGIRVYRYPGMSHVKAAIIDGWACLGSANWDKLSFRVNQELNIATSHPSAVSELRRRLFDADFQKSTEMTELQSVHWSNNFSELVADYAL